MFVETAFTLMPQEASWKKTFEEEEKGKGKNKLTHRHTDNATYILYWPRGLFSEPFLNDNIDSHQVQGAPLVERCKEGSQASPNPIPTAQDFLHPLTAMGPAVGREEGPQTNFPSLHTTRPVQWW